jgi:hypothetical protein
LLFAPDPSTLHGPWFDTTQPSTEAHPQVRISPATTYSELPQSGSPATHPQAASMRWVSQGARWPGALVANIVLVRLPFNTVRPSTWLEKLLSHGR